MAPLATTMPALTPDQFAQRMMALYPSPWTGQTAKQPGGGMYALFYAFGSQYQTLEEQLQFAFNACRIATATDVALDAIAADFFGPALGFPADVVRLPGEPDSSFRSRILASLLIDSVTIPALKNVLLLYTGVEPRIVEPFDATQTASYDNIQSYYDYDTPANPSRYGDTLPYQIFVESVLPPYNGSALPIYGYDSGLYYDYTSAPGGYYLDPLPSWFSGVKALDALLTRTKGLGITTWRRYTSQPLVTYARGQTIYPAAGAITYTVNLQPASAGFFSVIAEASWQTSIGWTQVSNSQFVLTFEVPAPSGGTVDWLCVPITNPGYGFIPVTNGATAASLLVQSAQAGYNFIAIPSWSSSCWITNLTGTEVDVAFGTPAPNGGQLSYAFFPPAQSGSALVTGGAFTKTITIPATKNSWQAFVMPTWDTEFAITKNNNGTITVLFSTPPFATSTLYWGFFQS